MADGLAEIFPDLADADPVAIAATIGDTARVRALLIAAARNGRDISYSELLGLLGLRFTRPRMRAVCRTLDAIDRAGATRGEPELAVLVVRETDRLPGQGWWAGRADVLGHAGAWSGAEGRALVSRLQGEAFGFWATHRVPDLPHRRSQ